MRLGYCTSPHWSSAGKSHSETGGLGVVKEDRVFEGESVDGVDGCDSLGLRLLFS